MTGPGERDRPVFDPRHDARFQRGYQPGEEPRTPERAGAIGVPPTARPAEPAWGDLLDGVRSSGDPDASAGDPTDADVFDGDAFQDEFARPRKNPFIVVLWVASILFIAAALTLQWQAATNSFASYSYSGSGPLPFGMLMQQLSYSIAPSVLIAGFATVAGLLFWHAWAWQARRGTVIRSD